MAKSRSPRRINRGQLRVAAIGLALMLAWLGMGYRLFQVQVVQAEEIAEMGRSQRSVAKELAPSRGKILDRNGDLLAMTMEATSLYVVPSQLEEPLWVAQQVGGVLGLDTDALYQRLLSDKDFVYLKRQVEPAVADQILGLGLRGVYSLPESTRVYPAGDVASHITGFVNIDGVGQEGIEYAYEDELRGVPGHAEFERDLRGRVIPLGETNIVAAIPGADLMTSIDLPLQYQAQQACVSAVARTGARSCWAVVLEVETGNVLAMAGAPVFDPTTRQTVDPRCDAVEDPTSCHAFSNFVVRGMYEPGSTEKLITFAAAIEEGKVKASTVIPDVADVLELREGACRSADDDLHGCYRDFDPHETSDMTVSEIFTASSNVGSILVAEKLGEDKLVEYIERFGLGARTGIDYAAEANGLLNFEAGCETCWASAAIGYSVAASPLQMAAAFAAIGNDGVWITPHIVSSRETVDGQVQIAGHESRRVVSESTAALMRELLAGVVEDGTGSGARVEGYRVGGKTGTANILDGEGRYTNETRASFVGLGPIDDPKVVVAVLLEAPAWDYRTGGAGAAPIFSAIMKEALHRIGATPDGQAG